LIFIINMISIKSINITAEINNISQTD